MSNRIFYYSYLTQTRPATWYFFFTRPNIEKPYPYGTGIELLFLKNLVITHDRYLSHHLYGAAQNDLKALVVANHVFNFEGLLSHL